MRPSSIIRTGLIILTTLSLTSQGIITGVSASQIGTGTVVGSGALTTVINWNDTFS